MPKHLKGKTFNVRHKKRDYKKRSFKYSRHKIGGAVSLNIPSIPIENNGGSDSQASLNKITETANMQNTMVRALTGGSGNAETYTVPTFTNGGDPYSDVPNANSVTRALIGSFVNSQVQSEYDKNAFKQSGGRRKLKSKKYKSRKNKHKKYKSRKYKSRN